jgi:hypothetical protein
MLGDRGSPRGRRLTIREISLLENAGQGSLSIGESRAAASGYAIYWFSSSFRSGGF